MKPFVINRNTWHYKLNQRFFNPYDFRMERWEAKHADFCSYWRATIFRVVFASLLASGVIAFLFAIGRAFYFEPFASFITMSVIVGFLAMLVGFALLTEYLKERNYNSKKVDKPESLLAQKYRAHKQKICPMVEFKE
jgi:H+/Cl- antiporter ClcA